MKTYCSQTYNPQNIFQYYCPAFSVPQSKDIVEVSNSTSPSSLCYSIISTPSSIWLCTTIWTWVRGVKLSGKRWKLQWNYKYILLSNMSTFMECIPYIIKGPHSTLGEWTIDLEWTMPVHNIGGGQDTFQFQTLIMGSCDPWEVIASAGTHRNSVWERISKLCCWIFKSMATRNCLKFLCVNKTVQGFRMNYFLIR